MARHKTARDGITYAIMSLNGTLFTHLAEIDEVPERRLEILMPQFAKSAGTTEALKARDPMRWTGLTNACKTQAEGIIFAELIYQETQNADI